MEHHPNVEIWPISFQHPIPILPVPLMAPDADVPIDLNQAIQTIYTEAVYDLRIDYKQMPPPPALPSEEAAWLEAHLQSTGVRP